VVAPPGRCPRLPRREGVSMSYKWQDRECDPKDGIPYAKKPNTYLEKTDAEGKVIGQDTFLTQSTADEAWADGWHVPNRPETRDIGPDGAPPTASKSDSDVLLEYTTKATLVAKAESEYGLKLDKRKTLKKLVEEVQEYEAALTEPSGDD